MTKTRSRILFSKDSLGQYATIAIDLDTKEQIGIPSSEFQNFWGDCIGIDKAICDRYNQGLSVQCIFSKSTWDMWVKHHFVSGETFVWLTVSREGDNDDVISAVNISDNDEVLVPTKQWGFFIADLMSFEPESFYQDYGVACRMSLENWQTWVNSYAPNTLSEEALVAAFA